MSVESETCSDRPFTSQNEVVFEKVCQIVMKDHHLALRKIVEEVGISRGLVHSILIEDLCRWRVSAKFISKLLMEQQTTTMLLLILPMQSKVFWPKTIWHLCDSLLTLLIWHHATSGYFPN